MSYSIVITDQGLTRLTAAMAGDTVVEIASIAIGDGNGSVVEPSSQQTELVREVYRTTANITSIDQSSPNKVTVECIIPHDVGGWTVREVGIFLDDGSLFAVASYPETYKPTPIESASRDLWIKMVLVVANAASITLAEGSSGISITQDILKDIFSAFDKKKIKMYFFGQF